MVILKPWISSGFWGVTDVGFLQFITVLLLYMRCSAINPADPGVLKNRPLSKHDENSSFSQISGDMTPVTSSPLSALQSMDRKSSHAEQVRVGWSKAPGFCSFTGLCMLCCGWLVKDDVCYNEAKYEQPVPEEDILFCTLCNAEVHCAFLLPTIIITINSPKFWGQ